MDIISPDDLVPFDLFTASHLVAVDLVYADPAHSENIFGGLYSRDALTWGHVDMVTLVLVAAQFLHKKTGWMMVIKDCLRPIEAQQKMVRTEIVRANPHWLEEPRFLSPPGLGGHPRGMAVDITALDHNGCSIDFGTPFDKFSDSPLPQHNRAHREHPDLPEFVQENRRKLDEAMVYAAQKTGQELILLSTEWWDFRFPPARSAKFAPISDADLYPWQKIVSGEAFPIPLEEQERMKLKVFDRLDKLSDF
ncbi:MAG TPA: M15 family metallopeptidase [Alphaproteobacteria bacterium]|nr:M15 family metallopeptidase [Alphaproteobacteria bacterium]HNS44135.1 M15 family metallopeptidase [Alphaproteobacteria bacterium]